MAAVKFAAYLEPLRAANGALRVMPGSHAEPLRTMVRTFDRRVTAQSNADGSETVERIPEHVCETEPGDVIAFDLRLFHASLNGRDRRQWTVTFYRDPATPEEERETVGALADDVAADGGSWGEYDPGRYPFYDPEWVAEVGRTWRAGSIRRLRELGALDTVTRPIEGTLSLPLDVPPRGARAPAFTLAPKVCRVLREGRSEV